MQVISPLRHRREAFAARARELHLWLLEVLAWLMARVPAPRFLKLDFRRDLRKTRREIRILIMLSMMSRCVFAWMRQVRNNFHIAHSAIANDAHASFTR